MFAQIVAIWRVGTASPSLRDRQFESPFLQRRVTCEPELRFSRRRPALLWIRRAREKRLPPPQTSPAVPAAPTSSKSYGVDRETYAKG